ncbi:exodeoxyribonuclease VII large subunit [Corynebacterium sp. sy039]|uniref:exodeoxyribonuclease VII large subunit n=1 Tax=Corynebacterium sp. sy039 TaxID=2599641 RepID=UPI0011B6EEED|nr:exodeoxyribonuclease VII large subunit [Corynebacterium sp. sy039]QDZ42301.1 exodeoxyribonuclease VII large subunit [Corynebacterium sp. sy039]
MTQQSPSPENAWPVREVNAKVKSWIERLGSIWVEGQITQLNSKPNWKMSYITLRDPQVEASISLTCPTQLLKTLPTRPQDGDRVVVFGKPNFYEGRGTFSLLISDIRPVGIGELLAKIERLRKQLADEGLFDPARKRALPLLPRKIGLITGRGSAAERDVISVAQARWSNVDFRVINTAVQGPRTVPEVIAALGELDADPDIDVIIIARGGGSVEDLLPFSEEALQRAVAQATTPVVSAIGHEPDNPVLDNVADVRAATPTDAAKRVVPDAHAEQELITQLRNRSAGALRNWVHNELHHLHVLSNRPVLKDPYALIRNREEELIQAHSRLRREIQILLGNEITTITNLRNQVSTLGPSATLARGYAIAQVISRNSNAAEVLTSIEQAPPGSQLRIRVSDGSISAAAMQTHKAD